MQNVTREPPQCVSWDFDSQGMHTLLAITITVCGQDDLTVHI